MSLQNQEIENAYLKYAWKILVVIGILTALFGLFAEILGTLLNFGGEFFEMTTGVNLNQFSTLNPEVADYLSSIILFSGALEVSFGLFGSLIAWKGFRHGEKWAWYAMWLFPISYGLLSIISLASINDLTFPALQFGGLGIISTIAILLPYKAFFPKNTP